MDGRKQAGFREMEHAADWQLEVWAPDLPGLLEQAARGMYSLSGLQLVQGSRVRRSFTLAHAEPERLLVQFLNELLFLLEREGVCFDEFEMRLSEAGLWVNLGGGKASPPGKEIKAITYHNLHVEEREAGLRARVVLDV